MRRVAFLIVFLASTSALAQISGIPRIPSGGSGIQGSAGIGFTDFTIQSPSSDMKLDRGMYIAASVERGFNVFHLYLTLTISHMSAEGTANYRYTNLSEGATYSASDVSLDAKMFDVGLGLKWKLIDNYWFRPYIEGGGLGGYHEIRYGSKYNELSAQGPDFKTKDVIMGSGYYGEAGVEIQFSDRFGVKLAGRISDYQTKNLETLDNQKLQFRSETYYLSGLMGF